MLVVLRFWGSCAGCWGCWGWNRVPDLPHVKGFSLRKRNVLNCRALRGRPPALSDDIPGRREQSASNKKEETLEGTCPIGECNERISKETSEAKLQMGKLQGGVLAFLFKMAFRSFPLECSPLKFLHPRTSSIFRNGKLNGRNGTVLRTMHNSTPSSIQPLYFFLESEVKPRETTKGFP